MLFVFQKLSLAGIHKLLLAFRNPKSVYHKDRIQQNNRLRNADKC